MAPPDDTMDLFPEKTERRLEPHAPLAERMRPRTLEDLIGHEDLVAPGRPLHTLVLPRDAHDRPREERPGAWCVGAPVCSPEVLARVFARVLPGVSTRHSRATGEGNW